MLIQHLINGESVDRAERFEDFSPVAGKALAEIGREGGELSLETFCEVKNTRVSRGSHDIPRWGL